MKAARLQAYGDVDQFKLEEVPDPAPGRGEVLVKVEASGLNPFDIWLRQGFLSQQIPLEMPAILGIDAAGTIAAVGSNADGFAVGDRVIAHLPINGRGANAEFTVASLDGLAKLPDNVAFTAGATLPLVGVTGRQAVAALGAKAGDRVLVSGALGGVGRAAVQYLKEVGARPVAGVRGERLAEGKAIAGEAIAIDEVPTAAAFDFVVSASAPVAANAIKNAREGGTVASVVQVPEGANPGDRVKIVNVLAQRDAGMLRQIADAAGRGELTIPVVATFRLAELSAAHRALAAGPSGKIIVVN